MISRSSSHSLAYRSTLSNDELRSERPWKGRSCPSLTTSSSRAPSRRSLDCSRTSRRSSKARPSRSSSCSPHSRREDTSCSRTSSARPRPCWPGRSPARSAARLSGGIQVHARHPADRRYRALGLRPADAGLRVQAGTGVRKRAARRRDQPRDAEDAARAFLEAMGERQMTVDGITHPLPDPFLLLATENLIEQEGTFPLPEAQLDRFSLKIAPSATRPSTRRSRSSVASGKRTRSRGFSSSSTSTTSSSSSRRSTCLHRRALLRWIIELVAVTRTLMTVALGAPVRAASRSSGSRERGRSSRDGTT